LKTHFARYGKPDVIVTDCGSQYLSEQFQKFLKKWDIVHEHSSPHHHQSNGKAESAVKAAKQLLRKTDKGREDPYLALLNLRNTPQQGINSSPAQRLFSHRTKTILPTTQSLLKSAISDKDTLTNLKTSQLRQAYYCKRPTSYEIR